MDKLIILFIVIIIIGVVSPIVESFEIVRKRKKGAPVQMGFLNNTPGPIKELMILLNKIGGQMTADKEYDTVATGYLDKDKIS